MATLTPAQLYAINRRAGFSPPAAVVMTAIDLAESGGRTDKDGDVALENALWGPSVGPAQIRTEKAQTGTGGVRDILKLRDPLANAVAAFQISGGGRDFTPWSTFTTSDPDRSYRHFLPTAQKATIEQAGVIVPGIPGVPQFTIPDLPNPVGAAMPLVRSLLTQSLFVGLGLGLVVLGAARAFSPQINSAAAAARSAVGV